MINLNHVCHQSWLEVLASQVMVQSDFLTLDDNHRYILITHFSKEQRKWNHNQNQHMQHMYCHNKNSQLTIGLLENGWKIPVILWFRFKFDEPLVRNEHCPKFNSLLNMLKYTIILRRFSCRNPVTLTLTHTLKHLNNGRKEISVFNNLFLQTRCFHIKFCSSDEEDALFLSA